ncbi:hypothetical protein [Aureivirga marina]|uniref:hypothetical protein n=1 Tax=Aureivirga marina TaxID=1182451 RepID=UPI0018C9E0BB|nr:hypothetical protein [Aureivirga marina]
MKIFLKLLLLSVILVSCQNKEEKLIKQFLEEEIKNSNYDLNKFLLKSIDYKNEEKLKNLTDFKEKINSVFSNNSELDLYSQKEYFINLIKNQSSKNFKNEQNFDFLDKELSENFKKHLLKIRLLALYKKNNFRLFTFCGLRIENLKYSKYKIDEKDFLGIEMKYSNILDHDMSFYFLNSKKDSIKATIEKFSSFSKIYLNNLEKGNYKASGKITFYTFKDKFEIPFQEQFTID